jgi:acylphosphatase
MARIRKHVYYHGSVQGVGFRYTTVRVANGYAVTGFVRNLPDGRVDIVVEGETQEIESFLADLADSMQGYIRNTQIHDEPFTGEFHRFDVRF